MAKKRRLFPVELKPGERRRLQRAATRCRMGLGPFLRFAGAAVARALLKTSAAPRGEVPS
jgi:hypothetical protein